VVAGKPAFSVPVAYVHNTAINKTEVALEFLRPDAAADKGKRRGASDPDELVEMRLYIPGTASSARRRDRKERVKRENGENGVKPESGSDVEMDESDGEGDPDEPSAAQTFHDEVKDKAEVGHVAGESLVTFSEVHCSTPRCAHLWELAARPC
jgi:structure-specific recognition protein 1